MIVIDNITVKYEDTVALSNINLTIKDHEFVGIIGPNGGGKTTLVKTLLGILTPNSGLIKFDKKEVLGYVPQLKTFERDFPITVEEVILTGHLPSKISFGKRFQSHEHEHAGRVMKRLGIEALKKRQIGALSGGQMQRVLIARALMNHPTVLILDEPTAGVDEVSKQEIYKMLEELNSDMTILMITHDTIGLMELFDRVVYINKTIHLHNSVNMEDPYEVTAKEDQCPIEWFVLGEKIQNNLMEESESASKNRHRLRLRQSTSEVDKEKP